MNKSPYPEGTFYQLVLVGAGGVGKSSLTIRYMQDIFIETYDPTIEDTYTKHLILDDTSYILDIMDTAGQEDFTALRNQYIRDGHGFLLVFSCTSERSLRKIEDLHKDIVRIKGERTPDIPILVVCNKVDLVKQRKVSTKEGEKFANEHHCGYIETSALTYLNVVKTFEVLTMMVASWQVMHAKDIKDIKYNKKRRACLLY